LKQCILFYFLLTSLWAEHPYTNALIGEESPYLQQHAHNPVDWYPWGNKAFDKAKRENRLIFLSIGYSTCHWCHVMEKESFENTDVAKLLNRDYISVKVDKEQYPQIDEKYQRIFSQFNGRGGGWPLTLFMTPDREVFYAATYIPREGGYGSDGLLSLLPKFSRLYREHPEVIDRVIQEYSRGQKSSFVTKSGKLSFDNTYIRKILTQIESEFDSKNGGFSSRPKFPESSMLSLLLDIYDIDGSNRALHMAEFTLDRMALGGLYDQAEGGFFRYTTDSGWKMPHFEKMLYTNAQLTALYAKAYGLKQKALYRRVVRESITEMNRHFMKSGLYLGASDADSEGEEGGYYIYLYEDAKKGLMTIGFDEKETDRLLSYFGIEEDGNIDGEYSHLHISSPNPPPGADRVKKYLAQLRKERRFPFVDSKTITSWNAMMDKALFVAGRVDRKYIEMGRSRIEKLLSLMSKGDKLYHQTLYGSQPVQDGLLEDYAYMSDALIEAQQATLDNRYLELATAFAKRAVTLFYRNGKWYLDSGSIGVEAEPYDSHYSSAMSVMLSVLEKLSVLNDEAYFTAIVEKSLKDYGLLLQKTPAAIPSLTTVFLRYKIGEIVVKAKRSKLESNRIGIEASGYPFILFKADESMKGFMACRPGACFVESDDAGEISGSLEEQKKYIGKNRGNIWR